MNDLHIDGLHWSTFTRLSTGQIAALREQADRDGRFVNPTVLHTHSARVAAAPQRWAHAILGRPFTGVRTDRYPAFLTIAYALDLEPAPPTDPIHAASQEHLDAARREQERALDLHAHRRTHAWDILRNALPVPSVVLYNYSGPLHLENYSSGANHIVLRSDLHVGRLHRVSGSALCAAASRRRRQIFTDTGTDDDGRVPTCRECLRTAARLTPSPAAAEAATLLRDSSCRAPRVVT